MVDEIFDDYSFAQIYDDFNGWGPGDDFYLEMARAIGGHVLDLGCGTGMLACRVAAEGSTSSVSIQPTACCESLVGGQQPTRCAGSRAMGRAFASEIASTSSI